MNKFKELQIKGIRKLRLTPKKAKEYMENNNSNRKLSNPIVKRYAREMSNGNWVFTHQGIAVDEYGNLVDGQHRCQGVIDSGVSIWTTLTIYCGEVTALMVPLDFGKKRSNSDITGVNKQEISIYNPISYLFPSVIKTRPDPSTIKEMSDHTQAELKFIEESMGINPLTSPDKNSDDRWRKYWTGPIKAILVAAVIDNIDISKFKDSDYLYFKTREFHEYFDFLEYMQGMGAGRTWIMTIMPITWGVLKHKKMIRQNEHNLLSDLTNELRDVFKLKYDDIF